MDIKESIRHVLSGVSVLMATATFNMYGATPTEGDGMKNELMQGMENRAVVYSVSASAFRESAMVAPQKAVLNYFNREAGSKWQLRVANDFSVQQQTDFFMGGILLTGPLGKNRAVVGIYNPWWDAILLLRLEAGKNEAQVSNPQVTDFILQCGETFRGEPHATNNVSCRTVVPEADPISVELWRVVSRTRKRFVEVFPMDGTPDFGRIAYANLNLNWNDELVVLQMRSLLRLQHSVGLLKNARDTGIAAFLTRLARKGTKFQLYTYFGKKETRSLVETFAEIPKEFRKDFIPYGYVPTKDGTLFTLVNKKMPILYMTVTLGKEIKADTSGMEWFYLAQAEELLAAWNNRKVVAK